jgi:hypothetical protein
MGQSCSQKTEESRQLGFIVSFSEKGCSETMEEVIRAYKCRDPEERIPILRAELDHQLSLLHEAMLQNSTHKIDQCKARLREIRREMLMLEVL